MNATQGIVVFICGPFRAETEYARRENIQKAEFVAKRLAEKGIYYICPHLNSAHFQGIGEDSFWLSMYQELLLRCDVIYVLAGAKESSGSMAELSLAIDKGITIVYSMEDLNHAISHSLIKKRKAQTSSKEQDDPKCGFWECEYYRNCQHGDSCHAHLPRCFRPVEPGTGCNPSQLSSHLPYTTR